jgi:hypothetical protein
MMKEGRRDRVHKGSRRADRWTALLVVVLAVAGGVVAGRSGTPKSWEHPAPGAPGGPKSVQSQGSP